MRHIWCKHCDEFVWKDEIHTCPPRWRVWDLGNDEDPEDGRVVYSRTSELAAEKCAELNDIDDGDYPILSGIETTYNVVLESDFGRASYNEDTNEYEWPDKVEIECFNISAVSEPVYQAEKK